MSIYLSGEGYEFRMMDGYGYCWGRVGWGRSAAVMIASTKLHGLHPEYANGLAIGIGAGLFACRCAEGRDLLFFFYSCTVLGSRYIIQKQVTG